MIEEDSSADSFGILQKAQILLETGVILIIPVTKPGYQADVTASLVPTLTHITRSHKI